MFGTVLALKVLDAQKCVDTFRVLFASLCAMSVVLYFVLNKAGGDDIGSLFLPCLFLFVYAMLFGLVCLSATSATKQFCSAISTIKKDSDDLHAHLWGSVAGLKNIAKRNAIKTQVKALQEASGAVLPLHVKSTAL